MALRYVDSFDHYDTAELSVKWDAINGGTIASVGRWGTNGYSITNVAFGLKKAITAVASPAYTIVGFAFRVTQAQAWTQLIPVRFVEGATEHVRIAMDSSGHLTITRAGTLLGTCSTVLSTNTWYYIEVKIKIDNTAGAVYVRINGTEETYTWVSGTQTTQDTQNGGTGVIDYVWFHLAGNASSWNIGLDDIYIADSTGSAPCNDFLGDVRVEALFPTGAGNYAQFTASPAVSNYQNVDENGPDEDATHNASATVNQIDSFAMGNLTPTGGTVYAVQANLYARKDDAGARSIAPFFRISSSDYVGSDKALQGAYDFHHQIYENSPATSSAWTVSEVNGAEAGYKLTV